MKMTCHVGVPGELCDTCKLYMSGFAIGEKFGREAERGRVLTWLARARQSGSRAYRIALALVESAIHNQAHTR